MAPLQGTFQRYRRLPVVSIEPAATAAASPTSASGQSRADQPLVCFAGRLDNRSDLARQLGVAPDALSRLDNHALLLNCYRQWGLEIPGRLRGDWAFALWDPGQQQLFLARDHFGSSSLYYYPSAELFAFAGTLRELLRLPGVPADINLPALAAGWLDLAGHVTCYQNIYRLPPAQALLVTRDQVKRWTYWQPADAPTVRFKRDDEYVAAFLDLYRQAVEDRLSAGGRIGILLSSGLDSSSVAALAAPALDQRGRPLAAFSAVPQYDPAALVPPGRCGDERPWIEALGRRYPNLELNFISVDNTSPIAAIERGLELLAEPIHGAVNLIWILALLQAAAGQQIDTMLGGWGGNLTISFNGDRPAYLNDLLKRGAWRRWLGELVAWRRQHPSIVQTVKSQVIKPLLPAGWLARYRARQAQGYRYVRRERLQLLQQAERQPTERMPGNDYNGLFKYFHTGKAQAAMFALGTAFGLHISDPPVDQRLIEFCLGLPQEQFTRQGQDRLLVRRAMAGKLPEEILWQGCRGMQSADIACRVRDHYDEAADVLASFGRSPLVQEYMDVPRMQDTLRLLQGPLDAAVTLQTSGLLKGMMQGLFLLRSENGAG